VRKLIGITICDIINDIKLLIAKLVLDSSIIERYIKWIIT
jgi:hypothetical protein